MSRKHTRFEKPVRYKERSGSGIVGKIVAVIIGIVIGAGAVAGTLVGMGYSLTKKPVKQTVNTVNSVFKTNIDLDEYLSDEYSSKTVSGLIGSLTSLVSDIKAQKASFGSLASVSPAVKKAVEALANEAIKLGVTIEKDVLVADLMEKPFSELGTYISSEVIGTTTLGALLQNTGKIPFTAMSSDAHKIVRLLLYGVEGEDYTIDTANKKFVPVAGGKPFLTINDLDNINDVLETIPLDALLPVSETNGAMNALAYGSIRHYTYQPVLDSNGNPVIENGKPKKEAVMNARYYTLAEGKAYDEDGALIDCTVTPAETEGEYVLTFGSGDTATYQYLVPTDTGAYEVYTNANKNVRVHYAKTTFGDFMDGDKDILNSLEIASLLNLENDGTDDKIMLALAYGMEGEDYYYDNGVRKYYAGKGPKTIADLTKDNAMSDLVDKLSLDTVMDINPDNDMLVTLAYGKSSRYTIVTETVNGKQVKTVKMKQVRYTKAGEKYYDIDGNETTPPDGTHLKAVDGVYYAYASADCKTGEEILYPKTTIGQLSQDDFFDGMEFGPLLGISPLDESADTLMLALAFGNKGEHYTIQESNGVKEIVWLTDADGNKYAPRTVKQFRTPEKLFEQVYIADALKVTHKSHSVLLALAYGEYEIIGEEIVSSEKKRTVGQLMDETESSALIDGITLASALSIDADTDSAILKTLAFGQADKHYKIVTEGEGETARKKVVMQQVRYTKEGEKYYDIDGNETTIPDGTHLKAVDGVYYAYSSADCKIGEEILYKKTTLGELGDNPEALIDKITLGDALGVKDEDGEDALKRALAYSKDGKAYTIGELKNDPNSIIYNIHLDSVMSPTVGAKTTLYLLYGREGVHFRIVDTPPTGKAETSTKITDKSTQPATTKYVEMLPQKMTVHYQDQMAGITPHYCLHNEYGESVEATVTQITNGATVTHSFDNKQYKIAYSYQLDGETYYLLAPTGSTPSLGTTRLKGKTSETGLTDVNRYSPTYYVMKLVDGQNTFPMYEHNTIAVLADADSALFTHLTERLTLDELMDGEDLSSNMFLEPLAHTTIDELPDAINDLRITDVFEYKIYAKHATSTEAKPVYIDENKNIVEERDGVWYIKDTNTKSSRVYEGPWKYLLDCNLPNTDEDYRAPESYTVTEIDRLIPNMTASMQRAKLNDLDKDNIIDLEDDMLTTPVTIKVSLSETPTPILIPDRKNLQPNGEPTMKTIDELGITSLGELTVEQMLAYIKGLLG